MIVELIDGKKYWCSKHTMESEGYIYSPVPPCTPWQGILQFAIRSIQSLWNWITIPMLVQSFLNPICSKPTKRQSRILLNRQTFTLRIGKHILKTIRNSSINSAKRQLKKLDGSLNRNDSQLKLITHIVNQSATENDQLPIFRLRIIDKLDTAAIHEEYKNLLASRPLAAKMFEEFKKNHCISQEFLHKELKKWD